jgi:dTDP-4-amino-4,6-dideoxygalactose transaminase
MPYYREKYRYKQDDLPVANAIGNSVLSLPITPQMTARDAQDVVDAVTKVIGALAG